MSLSSCVIVNTFDVVSALGLYILELSFWGDTLS